MSAAPETAEKEITLAWSEFLPHQWDLFSYELDEFPGPAVTACLGWWGSAKTSAAVRRFFRVAMANPWTPAYGVNRPQAVVMAPTSRILKKATMAKLEAIIPPELIIDRRKSPTPWWLLANGLEVSFVSGEMGFEGEDLCLMLIDEVQHPVFSSDPERFRNYQARLRDPLSTHLELIVCGLAESGWVKETFDTETLPVEERKNRYTRMCGTDDNPHLPKETLRQILATCPADEAEIIRRGGWAPVQGAVFGTWDPSIHLVDMHGDDRLPVSIGLDAGEHGGVVFGQRIKVKTRDITGREMTEDGLLVVDQMLTEAESVEDVCKRIKVETPWRLVPEMSEIYVDPTLRADEVAPLRRHFPGVRILQRDRQDPYYEIKPGIRLMRANLKDATGSTRLYFSRKLASTRSGIIEAIETARRNPDTGAVVKDDRTDHIRDACRYLCCGMLRAPLVRPEVIGGRGGGGSTAKERMRILAKGGR